MPSKNYVLEFLFNPFALISGATIGWDSWDNVLDIHHPLPPPSPPISIQSTESRICEGGDKMRTDKFTTSPLFLRKRANDLGAFCLQIS